MATAVRYCAVLYVLVQLCGTDDSFTDETSKAGDPLRHLLVDGGKGDDVSNAELDCHINNFACCGP